MGYYGSSIWGGRLGSLGATMYGSDDVDSKKGSAQFTLQQAATTDGNIQIGIDTMSSLLNGGSNSNPAAWNQAQALKTQLTMDRNNLLGVMTALRAVSSNPTPAKITANFPLTDAMWKDIDAAQLAVKDSMTNASNDLLHVQEVLMIPMPAPVVQQAPAPSAPTGPILPDTPVVPVFTAPKTRIGSTREGAPVYSDGTVGPMLDVVGYKDNGAPIYSDGSIGSIPSIPTNSSTTPVAQTPDMNAFYQWYASQPQAQASTTPGGMWSSQLYPPGYKEPQPYYDPNTPVYSAPQYMPSQPSQFPYSSDPYAQPQGPMQMSYGSEVDFVPSQDYSSYVDLQRAAEQQLVAYQGPNPYFGGDPSLSKAPASRAPEMFGYGLGAPILDIPLLAGNLTQAAIDKQRDKLQKKAEKAGPVPPSSGGGGLSTGTILLGLGALAGIGYVLTRKKGKK